MMKLRKIVLSVSLLLTVLLAAAYVGGNFALAKVSRRLFTSLAAHGSEFGVELSPIACQEGRIALPASAVWRGLATTAVGTGKKSLRGPYTLTVESVCATPTGLHSARLELTNLSVTAGEKQAVAAGTAKAKSTDEGDDGQLEVESLRLSDLPVSLFDPIPGIEGVARELGSFARTGKTKLAIEMEGRLTFSVGGVSHSVGTELGTSGDERALRLDRSDLARVSKRLGESLTAAEIDLLSENPLRTGKLLRIRDSARMRAIEAHRRDSAVPEDAYRHVLWSYLLTREFDAAFAKTVTDAHEVGPTGNTVAEREMDLHNNELGRQLQEQGVAEGDLLVLVQKDPRVIRTPSASTLSGH